MITICILRIPQVGFVIKVQPDDVGLLGQLKLCVEALERFVPARQREYDECSAQWCVEAAAAGDVRRWLAYASRNLFARIEWWSRDDDGPEDWTLPPPPRRRLTKEDAYKTLFLQPNSPPELVRVVFRYLATACDPDKDEENLKAVNAAYKQLSA